MRIKKSRARARFTSVKGLESTFLSTKGSNLLQHFSRDFLEEFRADRARDVERVHAGIEFDDVGADDLSFQSLNQINRLSCRWSTRLAMRHAGRKRRIECVDIKGDVN